MRLAIPLLLATLALSCSSDGSPQVGASPTPCVTPPLASDADEAPKELELHRHATIIDVKRRAGALGITAVSGLTVVELYPPLARAILDAGYSIVSSDNEGFEAEIFFGDDRVTGAYRLREGPCEDQVTVRLLFEDKGR